MTFGPRHLFRKPTSLQNAVRQDGLVFEEGRTVGPGFVDGCQLLSHVLPVAAVNDPAVTWGRCYKTFLSVIFVLSKSVCQNRLEKLVARDKHSSLVRKYVNYRQKSFITLAPGPNVTKNLTSVIYKFL